MLEDKFSHFYAIINFCFNRIEQRLKLSARLKLLFEEILPGVCENLLLASGLLGEHDMHCLCSDTFLLEEIINQPVESKC